MNTPIVRTASTRHPLDMTKDIKPSIADTYRVLIVDDHELAHSGLSLILTGQQFDIVGHLKSGAEVVPFVQSESVDIIILDLGLPDMHGLAVLAELVAVHDSTVIILSGEANASDFAAAINFGARAVVSKSDPTDAILEALNTVSNGTLYYSPTAVELMRAFDRPTAELTPRQMAILHFLAQGETNKEIGYRLRIAPPTVSFHLKEMRDRLDVTSNKKIVVRARELGLI